MGKPHMPTREVVVDWQRTNVPHEARRSRITLMETDTEADIPAILAARHNLRYKTDVKIFHVNDVKEEVA